MKDKSILTDSELTFQYKMIVARILKLRDALKKCVHPVKQVLVDFGSAKRTREYINEELNICINIREKLVLQADKKNLVLLRCYRTEHKMRRGVRLKKK